MTTIYRVQTRNGHGPYRYFVLEMFDKCNLDDLPEYVLDDDTVLGPRRHYSHDGFPFQWHPESNQDMRFGFEHPEQLVEWFLPTDHDADIMAEYAGLEVVAYSVPEEFVVKGGRQAAFSLPEAVLLSKFELDEFRALMV